MTHSAQSPLHHDLASAASVLARRLRLKDSLLALVAGSEEQIDGLGGLLRDALPKSTVVFVPTEDPVELNWSRDALVVEGRVTLLWAPDEQSAADFMRQTPDLTDWIELLVILELPDSTPEVLDGEWTRWLNDVESRNNTLDLTGILPGFSQDWRLPLKDLYLDLYPLKPQAVFEGRAPSRRILMMGHPGTGKTTFLRHMASELAALSLADTEHRVLPIILPALDIHEALEKRLRPLGDILRGHLDDRGYPPDLFDVAGDRLVVLIDALDESGNGVTVRDLSKGIASFCGESEGLVILTCRSAIIPLVERPLSKFQSLSPESPTSGQRLRYTRSLFRLHYERSGSASDNPRYDSELFIRKVEGTPDLKALASTPLTLAFLVLLSLTEGQLPERRVSLYHRLTQLLIERWNTARSLAGHRKSIPFGEALRIFAPLAWWMRDHYPSGRIPHEALQGRLVEQLTSRGETFESAEFQISTFLERLKADTLLLIPEGDIWVFFHPTVAEYLAGVELARNHSLRREIVEGKRLFDPSLREVVLFASAEMGVIRADDDNLEALVLAALKQSRRSGRYDARYSSLLSGIIQSDSGLRRNVEGDVLSRAFSFWLEYKYGTQSRVSVNMDLFLTGAYLKRVGGHCFVDFKSRFERAMVKPSVIDRFIPVDERVWGESLGCYGEVDFKCMWWIKLVWNQYFMLPVLLLDVLSCSGDIFKGFILSLMRDSRVFVRALGWVGLAQSKGMSVHEQERIAGLFEPNPDVDPLVQEAFEFWRKRRAGDEAA